MGVEIEPIDIFGLARMSWQGQTIRECLTDHARFDAGDRAQPAIELRGAGCHHSRLVIEVAQDAAGRWWSGYYWRCWHVPDGTSCATSTPIDAFRAETREAAIERAAGACLAHLPTVTKGKAARILHTWRRELAALGESERRAA